MDDRILEGPLGLVQQQIGRLQAQNQKSEALLNELREENKALHDRLATSEEELKKNYLALEDLANVNAQLDTMREVVQSLKDVIDSRDEKLAACSEQLQEKEVEIGLLKSRLKKAKRRCEEANGPVQAPRVVSAVAVRAAEIKNMHTDAERGEEPRAGLQLPCFEVLQKKG